MAGKAKLRLLFNENSDHADRINKEFSSVEHFRCCVAFAKQGGMVEISARLKQALEAGARATFVIGIDFCQTDPDFLLHLLRLRNRWPDRVKAMMGSYPGEYTFHPKLYIFERSDSTAAIIGSANLTAGGLTDNHELSLVVTQDKPALERKVDAWIANLERDGHIVEITRERISAYRRRHAIKKAEDSLAGRRARRTIEVPEARYETLQEILSTMRRDTSDQGFTNQQRERNVSRQKALNVLNEVAEATYSGREEFQLRYEDLITLWQSGGLHRGKTRIAKSYRTFQSGLRSTLRGNLSSPARAYRVVHEAFDSVPGAGISVMTEILHTLDNMEFAVMNQNSVAGLLLAGMDDFPENPNRNNVTDAIYEHFIEAAEQVREELNLANFTELDALFNYAYWDHGSEAETEYDEEE